VLIQFPKLGHASQFDGPRSLMTLYLNRLRPLGSVVVVEDEGLVLAGGGSPSAQQDGSLWQRFQREGNKIFNAHIHVRTYMLAPKCIPPSYHTYIKNPTQFENQEERKKRVTVSLMVGNSILAGGSSSPQCGVGIRWYIRTPVTYQS